MKRQNFKSRYSSKYGFRGDNVGNLNFDDALRTEVRSERYDPNQSYSDTVNTLDST